MWSDRADEAYKRLTRTITVPAGGATLSFWTSYNLELDFDYMIVEAHTVGQDDWTTLPDLNGHTSNDLSNDQSCTGGWSNPADAANVLHPFLTHYQTFDPADGHVQHDRQRAASGTPRTAARAAGSSSRSTSRPYAGQQVEVSITSLSDWGLQQFPGVFIDDIVVSTGEGSTSFEDDGDPMDGWTVPGAPQDDAGHRGPEPQRLGAPRRPRDQGGRGHRDARHALHGLRLRGHHRRDDAQRRSWTARSTTCFADGPPGAGRHVPPPTAFGRAQSRPRGSSDTKERWHSHGLHDWA